MILDSTVLVDVLRGEENVAECVEELDERGAPFVSSVTVMELREGIHLTDSSDAERATVEALLGDIHEFPFDHDCAMTAGRINADLVSGGEPIDETDVMIGATALVHDRPVLTRNVDHFERIGGLDVVTY